MVVEPAHPHGLRVWEVVREGPAQIQAGDLRLVAVRADTVVQVLERVSLAQRSRTGKQHYSDPRVGGSRARDEAPERARRPAEQIPSTWYYLSTDPRLFTADEAKAQFPDYASDVALWAEKGVTVFVNHAYDCKGYKGDRVIPMTRETVFIDRNAMKQIWPPQS